MVGFESGIADTVDPLAGSYFVETLTDDVERIVAWQCIGCGRIEGPQPCVGVCQDRKVTLVPADAYDSALARMRQAEARLAAEDGASA